MVGHLSEYVATMIESFAHGDPRYQGSDQYRGTELLIGQVRAMTARLQASLDQMAQGNEPLRPLAMRRRARSQDWRTESQRVRQNERSGRRSRSQRDRNEP